MINELNSPDNEEYLNSINDKIFQIRNPIIDETRKSETLDFLKTTVNGDQLQKDLVINATLEKDQQGVLVYVLTNLRLIKIEIGAIHGIKSTSFFLGTMLGVQWELLEKDRKKVGVSFQNSSIGLRYSAKSQEITDFFQQVEAQGKKGITNG